VISIGSFLNLTTLNEFELLIQFESITQGKVIGTTAKEKPQWKGNLFVHKKLG
jgi:hypothetical protein